MLDRLQVGVELVDEGDTGRDIELDDVGVRDVIEILDERAEAVAVGGDDDAFAGFDDGRDLLVPERKEPVDGILEALGDREVFEPGVAPVVARPALVGFFERRRRDVVAAAPDENLLVAVFGGGFGLVQTLEGAVMAFVEAPVFFDRDSDEVEFLEDGPEGVERALQERGVGDVEREPLFFEKLAGGFGFQAALVAEVDVGPAGEAVFVVPGAFAVADENELIHGLQIREPWFIQPGIRDWQETAS